MRKPKPQKAWVVAVDMGYGHERAAYALRDLAYGSVQIANSYPGIPQKERRHWRQLREVYEQVSRVKSVPVIGNVLFEAMDYFQQIDPFYPRRDLSAPNLQLRQTYRFIRDGLGAHLIKRCAAKPLPYIATFLEAAFAAEEHGYPGDIYCVICDADCSRTWAPLEPARSRIRYLAPNGRVVERLKLYGVKPQNITLTGFPLPKELIGGPHFPVLKRDLSRRLQNLDPMGVFAAKYGRTIASVLGSRWKNLNHKHPLTLTFAVGGAGAQKNLGLLIADSLSGEIAAGKIRLNLIAGTHHDAVPYYRQGLKDVGIAAHVGKGVRIAHAETRPEYFTLFSKVLHTTDVLWTKPSELSFYTGLGLPIIVAPPIGSQEQFNQVWLRSVGGGIGQNDPRYTNEWLFDWVRSGGLARAAWNGFIEAPTHGTYRIEALITGKRMAVEPLPLIV